MLGNTERSLLMIKSSIIVPVFPHINNASNLKVGSYRGKV